MLDAHLSDDRREAMLDKLIVDAADLFAEEWPTLCERFVREAVEGDTPDDIVAAAIAWTSDERMTFAADVVERLRQAHRKSLAGLPIRMERVP